MTAFSLAVSCAQNTESQRTDPRTAAQSEAPATSQRDLDATQLSCGTSNDLSVFSLSQQASMFIVNGDEAASNDPVTASTAKIYIPGGTCTGTLIGPNQLVTAAHCFENNQTNSFDYIDLNNRNVSIGLGVAGTRSANLRVYSFVPHPCYKGILGNAETGQYLEQIYYDVAIVTFSGNLPAAHYGVEIASREELDSTSTVTIAGYGAYSDTDRQARPLTMVQTRIEEITSLDEIQLEVNGKGACFGDSGGPTYIEVDGTLKVAGTTTGPGRSSNYSCAAGSGTMMDLSKYVGWIKCSLEQMGSPILTLNTDPSSAFCKDNDIIK